MNSTPWRQLQWIKQEQSLNTIAKRSGVPLSTLSYYDRGLRNLPAGYENNLRSYYGSEVNRRLKSAGLSSIQRERFRYYSPERVAQIETDMKSILNELTEARMQRAYYEGELEGNFDTWYRENYYKYEDHIRNGMQRSRRTYEYIKENYHV